jgi:hypothetical protein
MVNNMKTYSTWQVMRFAASGKRAKFMAPATEYFCESKAIVDEYGAVEFKKKHDGESDWVQFGESTIDHRNDWVRVVKKKKRVIVRPNVESVMVCDVSELNNQHISSVTVEAHAHYIGGGVELVASELLTGPGWRIIAERDEVG